MQERSAGGVPKRSPLPSPLPGLTSSAFVLSDPASLPAQTSEDDCRRIHYMAISQRRYPNLIGYHGP